MKPLHWRESAKRDLDNAVVWYALHGGLALELRFIAAVEEAAGLVSSHPSAGSSRHAALVSDLPATLRFFPVRGFERYLIYYLEQPGHVEVIRIWDSARGLQALMGNEQ